MTSLKVLWTYSCNDFVYNSDISDIRVKNKSYSSVFMYWLLRRLSAQLSNAFNLWDKFGTVCSLQTIFAKKQKKKPL